MKFYPSLVLVVITVPCFLFSGCDDDDPEDITYNIVYVDEDIDSPTTWTYGNIYVIRAWDFYVNSPLTIEAGVIVKFTPDGYWCGLSGDGVILAGGEGDLPIIFTSIKDDDHGGDNNGDGEDSHPAVADWGTIDLNGASGSIFDYCHFYYGGDIYHKATLRLYNGRGTVTHCTFAHNSGGKYGDYYHGALDATDATLNSVIENNIFYDNQLPLTMHASMSISNTNSFSDPSDASVTNTMNGIFVSNDIERDVSWEETEVAIVMCSYDMWQESGSTLTLANNVVLKFLNGLYLSLQDGPAGIINGQGSGVYFTSFRDDELKGDTNGDGNASLPEECDWIGLYDDPAGLSTAYLTWPNILYDGGYGCTVK